MDNLYDATEKSKRDYFLIQRIQNNNDQEAYTLLYNYYYKSLYFLMYKMTNCSIESEDLTIEAFEKAFQEIHNYKREFAFSTWLFKIASNNCIDRMRKIAKQGAKVKFDLLGNKDIINEKIFQSDSDPEQLLIKSQKVDSVRKTVNKMSPMYSKVLELKYLKEFSIKEIANTLSIPVNTVKIRIFRAKEEFANSFNYL